MKTVIRKKIFKVQNATWLWLCMRPIEGNAANIESILRQSAQYLTGSVAKGAGLLAILATGYLTLFTQKMPKEQFVMVLLGLGIIFGGTSLYTTLIR